MSLPLILFAKAPVAGRVKTRLQTHCSAEQAAEIAKILMQQTIESATRYWQGDVWLSVWPDAQHDFLQEMISRYQLHFTNQIEGDLGAKMHDALSRPKGPAVVMGCDVPHCSALIYKKAYDAMSRGDNVIGPSQDGGYYLLGLQQAESSLFSGMVWGGDTVFRDTLNKAHQIDLDLVSLPELNDVDEWSDLMSVAPQVPSLARFLRDEL